MAELLRFFRYMRYMEMYPGYIHLYRSGELQARAQRAFDALSRCSLCPRKCGVNRLKGQMGYCKAKAEPAIFNYKPHFGEEPPISGYNGSGTIFFANCTLGCLYCQNYRFSQMGEGGRVSIEGLGRIMLELQNRGCHNINLVTPTHYLPHILKALCVAIEAGLEISLVYNTSGFETVETVQLLNGIVDIYLADMRYGQGQKAQDYSNAPDYVAINRAAILQMYRQVGNLIFDQGGSAPIGKRGLLIRHLILPNGIADTEEVLQFIAENISPEVYVSLMSQYYPAYRAKDIPPLSRRITEQEYGEAFEALCRCGLENGWVQTHIDDETFAEYAGTSLPPITVTPTRCNN